MILDKEALFSEDQSVTTTAVSANTLKTGGDIGKGEPVNLLIQVTETFAALTSLTAELQTSDTENFAAAETLMTSGAVPAASLVKGYRFPIKVLPSGVKKYLRTKYTVTGNAASAGKITAGLTDGIQENHN